MLGYCFTQRLLFVLLSINAMYTYHARSWSQRIIHVYVSTWEAAISVLGYRSFCLTLAWAVTVIGQLYRTRPYTSNYRLCTHNFHFTSKLAKHDMRDSEVLPPWKGAFKEIANIKTKKHAFEAH